MEDEIRLVFVADLSPSNAKVIEPQFNQMRVALKEEILEKFRKRLPRESDIAGIVRRPESFGNYPVAFSPGLLLAIQGEKLAGFLDSDYNRKTLRLTIHYIDPAFRKFGEDSLWPRMVWKAVQRVNPSLLEFKIAKSGKEVIMTREQMREAFQPRIPVRQIKNPEFVQTRIRTHPEHQNPSGKKMPRHISPRRR